MPDSSLEDILKRLRTLQAELEQEIEQLLQKKRESFRYSVEQGKVRFEQGVKKLQQRYKISAWRYLIRARVGHIISAPFIYMVFIPFVLLDLTVTLYQHVCFRIYGIARVPRATYIIIDRQKLAYLNTIQKFNCVYCGYSNGLLEYVREVAARTEQYWCPIKHARRSPDPHRLSDNFVDFGDAKGFQQRLRQLQQEIIGHGDKEATEQEQQTRP